MNEENVKLEKINFISNISFIILISLSLINQYAFIALVSGVIYLLFFIWMKK